VQTCTKCNKQSPDAATQCVNCHAELNEWSSTAQALKRFQANPRVQYVQVAVGEACCPACRETQGAYPKSEAPRLPVEGCSHGMGCRCFYQPFLDDIFP
jgi:hypothetical protein